MGGSALATSQVNQQVQHDLTPRRAARLPAPLPDRAPGLPELRGGGAAAPLRRGSRSSAGSAPSAWPDALTPVSTYALNIVTGIRARARHRLQPPARLPLPGGAPVTVPALRRSARTDPTAGRTVAFSSITVAAAIATLSVFPLGFLRSMGIAGGLVGPLAGLIALTVLPALFLLLGDRVNALSPGRWRRAAERAARGEAGGWYRLAQAADAPPRSGRDRGHGAPRSSSRCRSSRLSFTGVGASVLPPGVSSRVVDTALPARLPGHHGVAGLRRSRPRRPPRRRAGLRPPPPRSPRAARSAAAAAGERRLGGVGFLGASRSSTRPRGGSSARCARSREGALGGSTAQFLDQKHALGSLLPLAGFLLAAVTFVLL